MIKIVHDQTILKCDCKENTRRIHQLETTKNLRDFEPEKMVDIFQIFFAFKEKDFLLMDQYDEPISKLKVDTLYYGYIDKTIEINSESTFIEAYSTK